MESKHGEESPAVFAVAVNKNKKEEQKKSIELELVVAVSDDGCIGYRDIRTNSFGIPWKIPLDLKHFQELTVGNTKKNQNLINAVVMGRHTWESLPVSPLKQRLNIIITHSETVFTTKLETCKSTKNVDPKQFDSTRDGFALTAPTLQAALDFLQQCSCIHRVFVIGGFLLYAEAMTRKDCTTLHISGVHMQVCSDQSKNESNESKESKDNNKTWIHFPPIPTAYIKENEFHTQVIEQLSNEIVTLSTEVWKRMVMV